MKERQSDTLYNYEQACNMLAHTFESILMRDYDDDTDDYTPSGYWIGDEIGGLWDFASHTVSTQDMAVMLRAIEEGCIEPRNAFNIYSEWEYLMCRAYNLKSTYFGADDKRIHFINLDSWIKGYPNQDLINAITEAECRKAYYEAAINDIYKKYGSDTETGFPEQFTNHNKTNNNVDRNKN